MTTASHIPAASIPLPPILSSSPMPLAVQQQGDVAMECLDDQQLLRRCAQHDDAAYRIVLERYGPLVHAYCRRRVAASDVDDVCQAVFVVFLEKVTAGASMANLPAWLLVVARNIISNHRRQSGRRPQAVELQEHHGIHNQSQESGDGELIADLDAGLDKLPRQERDVVTRCYIIGQSHAEIAQELTCSINTISSRVRRGMQRLRAHMQRRGWRVGSLAALAAILLAEEHASWQACRDKCIMLTPTALRLRHAVPSAAVALLVRYASGGAGSAVTSSFVPLLAASCIGLVLCGLVGASAAEQPLVPKDSPVVVAADEEQPEAETAYVLYAALPHVEQSWQVLLQSPYKPFIEKLEAAGKAERVKQCRSMTLSAGWRGPSFPLAEWLMSRIDVEDAAANEAAKAQGKTRVSAKVSVSSENTSLSDLAVRLAVHTQGTETAFRSTLDDQILTAMQSLTAGRQSWQILPQAEGAEIQHWQLVNKDRQPVIKEVSRQGLGMAERLSQPGLWQLEYPPANTPGLSQQHHKLALQKKPAVRQGYADAQFGLYVDEGGKQLRSLLDFGIGIDETGFKAAFFMSHDEGEKALPEYDLDLPACQLDMFARIPTSALFAAVCRVDQPVVATVREYLQHMSQLENNAGIELDSSDEDGFAEIESAINEVMAAGSGNLLLWCDAQPLIPAFTVQLQTPRSAAQQLVGRLGKQAWFHATADDAGVASFGMVSLQFGYVDGHVTVTTRLDGLDGVRAVTKAGGFDRLADIQAAWQAMPNKERWCVALIRPEQLVAQVLPLLTMNPKGVEGAESGAGGESIEHQQWQQLYEKMKERRQASHFALGPVAGGWAGEADGLLSIGLSALALGALALDDEQMMQLLGASN